MATRPRSSATPSPSPGGPGPPSSGATKDRERARDGGRGERANNNAGGATAAGGPDGRDEDEDMIGPYVIGEEIGRGSFATVFRGWHKDTGRPVAVKAVIRRALTQKLLENLESEISILKRITHPNIVELKDCLKTDAHIYLIMAFCSAGDLSVYIRKRGAIAALSASNAGLPSSAPPSASSEVLYPHPPSGGLNETIVRSFLGQLRSALVFLRGQNVIHRDIKPQNLLLQPPEQRDIDLGHPRGIPLLKVADFGFAKWLPNTSLAETLCGSPLYMAPEILRYEKYDAKADLWSVGAVLYEMSVGKPPFRAQNHVDLLRKIERGEDRIKFPDEKSHRHAEEDGKERPPATKVAEDIKRLIRKLLKRNPSERMSFEEFFRDAEEVAELALGHGRAAPPVPAVAARPAGEEHAPAFVASYSPALTPAPGQRVVSGAASPALPPPTPVTDDAPAFARPSPSGTPVPSSSVPPSPAMGRRSSSFQPNYVVSQPSAHEGVRARDFATPTPPPMAAEGDKGQDSDWDDKEYVVVEKRTVEINALADELATAPKRQLPLTRRGSRGGGFLGRPTVSTGGVLAGPGGTVPSPPSNASPRSPPSPVSTVTGAPYPPTSSIASTPPFAIPGAPTRTVSQPLPVTYGGGATAAQPHAYSASSSPRPLSFMSSSPRSVTAGFERFPGSPLALVGSPTAAIAKALNLASLKLFGSPTTGIFLRRSSSTRKPFQRTYRLGAGAVDGPQQGGIDSAEEQVLAELDDLTQKAQVLFEFADSKIMLLLPPTPASSSTATNLGTPSYFSHVAAMRGDAANSASSPFSPIPTSPAMRRTSSSSSERPSIVGGALGANSVSAEQLSAEAMVLYLRSLAFLGKGIEHARKFWAARAADQSASPEFNEAVQWLRARFNECFDKAEFAKARCGDDLPESATCTVKLVYDRALEISKTAAVLELRGENPGDCELAYETALWMLYAILDDTMAAQEGEAIDDTDRATVDKFVTSISARLRGLQRKLA